MNDPTTTPPVAYSYIRFSHPDQAKGDSLRRQVEAAADWCRRHNVTLDTSTTLRDLAKSAYTGDHRSNPDRHALALFLKLVEEGRVPRGAYLLVENLDRLSREHIQPALLLVLNLLQAGVRVVQLKPSEMVFDDKSDTLPVMMMMMELSRGHGESAIKSDRVGAAWAQRRVRARAGDAVLTRRLPAWVKLEGGKPTLIPEKADAIRRVFSLSAAGYGTALIVKTLTSEGVPPIGDGGHWSRSYVGLLLNDRRALGELQPRRRDGSADGAVLTNYFPAVVTEADWLAARGGASQRRQKGRGRIGEHVNLFAGLIVSALDPADTYYAATRTDGGKHTRVLINTKAAEGRAECRSFPLEAFERAVLSRVREIDPREVLGTDGKPDEVLVLSGQRAAVEGQLAAVEAELLAGGDCVTLGKVARALEQRKREIGERLRDAQQKAASPLSGAWGECRGLLEALDAAADQRDARLRLRSALRRIINRVVLLVVPRGRVRLAAVQLHFAGGDAVRLYVILHRPAYANGRKRVEAPPPVVISPDGPVNLPALDLRRPDHAASLEALLLDVDLSGVR